MRTCHHRSTNGWHPPVRREKSHIHALEGAPTRVLHRNLKPARSSQTPYLRLETLDQDGDQQVEEHVVPEGHESHEIQGGAGRGGNHAVVQHHVPVLLSQDLQGSPTDYTSQQTQAPEPGGKSREARRRGYLEDGDDGPQQGVEVLPVRYGVTRLRLQAELTAKYVHPQNTATQAKT